MSEWVRVRERDSEQQTLHWSKYFQTFISIWDYLSVMSFGAIDFIMFGLVGSTLTHISHASSCLSKKHCVQMHNLLVSHWVNEPHTHFFSKTRWDEWNCVVGSFFFICSTLFSFVGQNERKKCIHTHTLFGLAECKVAASKCSNSLSAISFVFFLSYIPLFSFRISSVFFSLSLSLRMP